MLSLDNDCDNDCENVAKSGSFNSGNPVLLKSLINMLKLEATEEARIFLEKE